MMLNVAIFIDKGRNLTASNFSTFLHRVKTAIQPYSKECVKVCTRVYGVDMGFPMKTCFLVFRNSCFFAVCARRVTKSAHSGKVTFFNFSLGTINFFQLQSINFYWSQFYKVSSAIKCDWSEKSGFDMGFSQNALELIIYVL